MSASTGAARPRPNRSGRTLTPTRHVARSSACAVSRDRPTRRRRRRGRGPRARGQSARHCSAAGSPARSWPSPSSSGVTVGGIGACRRAGRAGSPRSCPTARSARPGRPRSAAPPGPPPGRCAACPRSRPARRRRRRGSGGRRCSSTGSPLISRPTISFCWLPPDSAEAATSMPGVRTSYSRDDPLGVGAGAGPVDPRPGDVGRAGSGGRGSGSPRAAPPAAGPAGAGPRGCSRCPASRRCRVSSSVMSRSPSRTVPAGRPHAHDRLDQLGLAVALDPGDAEHLAGVDGQRDVVEQRPAVAARARSARAPPARPPAVTVDSRVSGDGSSLPTISSASWRAVTSAGSTVATVVPRRTTVISSATASTSSSLCEMNRIVRPSDLSSAQVAEQLVDLLRHQHRGGLVQDEDPGAAVEHLEDLHPLPVADAELLDQPVRRRRRARTSRRSP